MLQISSVVEFAEDNGVNEAAFVTQLQELWAGLPEAAFIRAFSLQVTADIPLVAGSRQTAAPAVLTIKDAEAKALQDSVDAKVVEIASTADDGVFQAAVEVKVAQEIDAATTTAVQAALDAKQATFQAEVDAKVAEEIDAAVAAAVAAALADAKSNPPPADPADPAEPIVP